MKILHFVRSVSEIYGTYTYLHNMREDMSKYDVEQIYLCYEPSKQNNKNVFNQSVTSLDQIDVDEFMEEENPDIIHFHDVVSHYLITNDTKYKAFYEYSKRKIRVRTLHDYSSVVCPNYLKYPEGIFCEEPVNETCVKKNCISKELFDKYNEYLEEIKKYDGIFYFSDNVKNTMQKLGFNKDKSYYIPPLVKEQQDFSEGKKNNILFVGRIANEKGLVDLLHAAALLKTDNWHLYIAGADSMKYLKYLLKLADNLKIINKVEFLGFLPHEKLKPYFLDSKIMSFPSTCRETYGFSGAEAVSYGIPVVTYDIQGINNWSIDGYTVISVPNHNVHALASAMDLLLSDNNVYKDYQANCREWSRNLDYQGQIKKMYDLYSKILNKKHQSI